LILFSINVAPLQDIFFADCIYAWSSFVSAQVSTSILPYLKLWPVDTYVDLMMQVTYFYLLILTDICCDLLGVKQHNS